MASTALTTVSLAQTAPADAPATAAPAPAAAAPPATPPAAATPPAPAAQAPAAAPASAAAVPAIAAKPALTPVAPAAPVATAKPAPAQATASAGPKAAAPASFGTIVVPEPAKPQANVSLSQPGLTASPTDFAVVRDKASAPAGAAAAGPAAAAGAPGTGRPVSLGGSTGQDLGGGYLIPEEAKKTRSTVTRDAIDKQSPTANPYQLINLLPGVVAASTDGTGLNGGNVRIRGFNSDHIGLTIEGAPVNDSGNYALFPQEYLDAENIGQISIAQGTPDIDSPHVGATGGVINIYGIDPSKKAGALVDYSFGSNNLTREFARVETGQIGAVRAFFSYSHLEKDHWAAPGKDDRTHLDFKLVADISAGNTIRFSAIWNDALNNFYLNPTLAQFNVAGSRPSYQGAIGTSTYFDYRVNPFKNLILSAPSNFQIADNLKFDTIP